MDFYQIVHVCSCVKVFAILWTIACQVPLSMGFFRQEHWSGLPFPPSGYLSDPGIKSLSAALLAGSLPAELLRKPFSQDIVISENIRTQEKKIQNPKRVCYIFYKLKVKCPNLNIFMFFKTYKYTTTLYKNM